MKMDYEAEQVFCECEFCVIGHDGYCANCGLPVPYIEYDDSPESYTTKE